MPWSWSFLPPEPPDVLEPHSEKESKMGIAGNQSNILQGGGNTAPEAFNPGNQTVDEVKDYVTANPAERDRILDDEQSGKNRVTLVEWLSGDST